MLGSLLASESQKSDYRKKNKQLLGALLLQTGSFPYPKQGRGRPAPLIPSSALLGKKRGVGSGFRRRIIDVDLPSCYLGNESVQRREGDNRGTTPCSSKQGLLDSERESVGLTMNEFKGPKQSRPGTVSRTEKRTEIDEGRRKGCRELKWLRRKAHSTSIYRPEHAPRALRAYGSSAGRRRRCVSTFRQDTSLRKKDLMDEGHETTIRRGATHGPKGRRFRI
jgi:hypothetical protein